MHILNRCIKDACARNQEEKTPECSAAPRRQETSPGHTTDGDEWRNGKASLGGV